MKAEFEEQSEKRLRKKKLDRTSHTYSDQDFYDMDRHEQLRYAKELRWKSPDEFDALKLFKFSKTKFWDLCQKLGFEDSVIDGKNYSSLKNSNSINEFIITIDRNQERKICERKYRLRQSTCDKIDSVLSGLSNVDKSIALDAIVEFGLKEMIRLKKNDSFKVVYPAQKERRLI